jgi:hypothetical protein
VPERSRDAVFVASRADRERRLQRAIETFEFEDAQDGTDFDCAFLDAIALLKRQWGLLANRLKPGETAQEVASL